LVETISVVVDVISAPSFSISTTGSGTYCEGESVTLNVSPTDPNFSYQWFNDSGEITGATNATFNPTESGNYFVEATDNNNTSCPNISTAPVTIEFLQEPSAAFSLPTEGCTGNSISFTDESVVDNNATANYFWSFGDGNVSTERNPTHIYNSSGTFDVSLEITYDGFTTCTSELSQSITINGELNFSISSSSTAICEGDSSVLSVDNPFNTYNWSTGETSSSIIVREAGDYSVTVTDANGCEGTSEITVTSAPSPTVELNASNTVVSPNDTITLNATGLANYIWSPDSAIIRNSSDEVQMVISNSTTVTVEGTNSSGCFGSASIQIRVEESNIGDVIVPEKFFSPNNDGIADSWKIEEISNYPQCGIEIYDQTGNKIYEAKPYNNDWQGTSNGQPIPDGVYYFVIRCDDAGLVKSGSITLLR
jgi:gliding motility-associated-like protein